MTTEKIKLEIRICPETQKPFICDQDGRRVAAVLRHGTESPIASPATVTLTANLHAKGKKYTGHNASIRDLTPLERGEAIHNAMLDDTQESPSMKLVDILARELDAWPEPKLPLSGRVDYCCQSDTTTEVFFGDGRAPVFLSVRAENTENVRVTRAEWQAAVDALNAPKADAQTDDAVSARYFIGRGWLTSMAHVDWPRRVYSFDLPPGLRDPDANLVVDSKPNAEPKPVEWDGEGLPPVGVDCEVSWDSDSGTYVTCRVLAHDEDRAVFRFTSGERKGEYQSGTQCLLGHTERLPNFRPIKTAEQLAEDQREAVVRRMAKVVSENLSISGDGIISICGALHDAGYIKQRGK